MPTFERDGATIHYQEYGRADAFPILTFAPGGMRSAAEIWGQSQWDPRSVLAQAFRVIAPDQRNAGASRAPVRESDGWAVYTADHLGLLDHLGIERCHLLGGCIGSSYCLGVIEAAPERVAAAVLQNPIGLAGNREAFHQMFDGWADALRAERPVVPEATWSAFRERMYGSDFVFNVSRAFVERCPAPLLVLMGSDLYHPEPISREIAALAPDVELIEQWKEPDRVDAAVSRVLSFLGEHTPGA